MPILLLLLTLFSAWAQEPAPMSFDDFEAMAEPASPARRAKLREAIEFAADAVEAAPNPYERIRRLLELAHLHHEIGRDAGSRDDLEQAVSLYRQVLEALPNDALKDHATFFLGFSQRSLRDPAALDTLRQLLRMYPRSDYAPHAWLHLGEAWFDAGDHPAALKAYQQAAGPGFELAGFALYKQAWTHERLGDPEAARAAMGQVVLDDSRPDLAVVAYEVLDFWFRRDRGHPAPIHFADALRQRAKPTPGCRSELPALKRVQAEQPLSLQAVASQRTVVRCLVELGERGPATTEFRRLENRYGPGSHWWSAQDRGNRKTARRLIHEALLECEGRWGT